MIMNIKQLHYFHELAKHQHFARAAKACHITQPTLSASITALEKNLGTDLVVRTSQFVALTEAGELVRQYAERMLLEQEALKQELALFHGELSGTLRIGIVPQSNVDIMPLIAPAPAMPPMLSEWPFKYLVAEWITMSKPYSSGRCAQGVAKVLSITEISPLLTLGVANTQRPSTFQ